MPTTFTDNFDSDTVGSTPANWSLVAGTAPPTVVASSDASSGTHVLQGQAINSYCAIHTAAAPVADQFVRLTSRFHTSGGSSSVCTPVVRSNGFAYYTVLLYSGQAHFVNWTQSISSFFPVPTFADGTLVCHDLRIVGQALYYKCWAAGTPEPTYYMSSVTDAVAAPLSSNAAITGIGAGGFLASIGGGQPNPVIDDYSEGTPGSDGDYIVVPYTVVGGTNLQNGIFNGSPSTIYLGDPQNDAGIASLGFGDIVTVYGPYPFRPGQYQAGFSLAVGNALNGSPFTIVPLASAETNGASGTPCGLGVSGGHWKKGADPILAHTPYPIPALRVYPFVTGTLVFGLVGDSITAFSQFTVLVRLQAAFPHATIRLVNAGRGGSTSGSWGKADAGTYTLTNADTSYLYGGVAQADPSAGKNTYGHALDAFRAAGVQYVSLMLGANDATFSHLIPSAYAANLQSLASSLAADLPTLKKTWVQDPAACQPDLSGTDQHALTLLQAYGPALSGLTGVSLGLGQNFAYSRYEGRFFADGLHPNSAAVNAAYGINADTTYGNDALVALWCEPIVNYLVTQYAASHTKGSRPASKGGH